MPRLFLLLLVLASGGCSSYTNFISSSSEEKRASYKNHRALWTRPGSPSRFGRARSVQLLQGSRIQVSDEKLEASGKLGMAALITPDGYALTAAHVISGVSPMNAALRSKSEQLGPVHAQWVVISSERDPEQHSWVQLFAYSPRFRLIHTGAVEIASIRVVRVFSGRDLALVKLPLRTTHWFDTFNTAPLPGTILFASGNGATPYRGPSAGHVLKLRREDEIVKTITTSVPLASGDSGGPVFDTAGRLVGIVSHVRPSALFPVPRIDQSSLRTIDAAQLLRIIEEDRTAAPQASG